ncbi:Crp/Fnr family transcriptional regulator [Vibrio sp. T187]|uniref:Crp/Fnr family transcriptional regulator n=1 Tax=Vibrio TaxID=662 RepID=UPI0010C93EEB|nr:MULTISPECIES: Crp/Fnr family transcriptional regulator [Vibrio]MBW3698098.1 Crp/Fnr family transcriptional regulator [Vibrio sp. T187]
MKTHSFNIQWPCELSDFLKQKLLECAIEFHGIPDRALSARVTQGGVFYITKGIMSVSFSAENTNSMNASLLGSGTWFGGSIMSASMSFNATVDELLPVSFIYFPKDKIDKLALSNNEVYKWLYFSVLEVQQDWLKSQLCSLYDRESRIVFSLLQIAKRLPSVQGSLVKIDISQKQLSQITGISRPRLNEVLKELEAQKELSLERGSIHILDIPALSQRISHLDNDLPSQ